MEDRETPRMCKYGESKTTQIMMANVPHVTSRSGLRKFQADGIFVGQSVHYFLWVDALVLGIVLDLNLAELFYFRGHLILVIVH